MLICASVVALSPRNANRTIPKKLKIVRAVTVQKTSLKLEGIETGRSVEPELWRLKKRNGVNAGWRRNKYHILGDNSVQTGLVKASICKVRT